MKKFQALLAKLTLICFIVSNIFVSLPVFSFAAAAAKGNNVDYVLRANTEIIIKYKDENKIDNVRSLVKSKLKLSKFDRKNRFKRQKIDILEIGTKDDANKVIQELRKNPDVEYAQPNYKLELTSIPTDSRFEEQWGLLNNGQSVEGKIGRSNVDINAVNAWNLTTGSASVKIGVLDTGIDIGHKDLLNSIFVNSKEIPGNDIDDDANGYIDDYNGWDFANNDETVFDTSSVDRHGTYTAGIIAANTTNGGILGVAPNVKLVPLKFINGTSGYTCDAIKAIEYAMDMGIKIVNCSFGGTDNNFALKDAMQNSGILFICAAGNRGGNISELPMYPACFNLPNILSVASVDGNGVLAPFSGYGDVIHVAAPGTNILSTVPENSYDFFSGTSVSAPFVTGIAALVASYLPNSSITEITNRIKSNVVSCTNLQGKLTTGGRVDAYAALANTKPNPDTYNGPGQNIDTIPLSNQEGAADIWYTQDQYAKIKEKLHYGESGVNPASGNYSFTCNDLSIPAPGFQINISRSYNSRDEKDTPLGRGWTFGFEGSAKSFVIENEKVIHADVIDVTLPTGGVNRFRVDKGYNGAPDSYIPEDSRSTFTMNSDRTSVLTTKDNYTYGFNTYGWLEWMRDKNGNEIHIYFKDPATGKFDYIIDTVGRRYTITYDPNNPDLIQTITDPQNRTVTYYYNDKRLLNMVKDPSGNLMRYGYDSDGFLDRVDDHYLKQVVSLTYNHAVGDNQHKVSQIVDASGLKCNYSYDVTNKKTVVTDSNSRSWTTWYDSEFFTIKTQDPEGKNTSTVYYLYTGKNKFGEKHFFTDRNGNTTEYFVDTQGNITKIINPDLSEKNSLYDSKNNLKYEIDECRKRTDYTYDSNGNLKLKVQPLNGTDIYVEGTSNTTGFAITSYDYFTKTEALAQFNCNANGLLKSITDPMGHVTSYKYNSNGDVIEEKDPEGNIETSHYNNIGWKDYTISPNIHRTNYAYDANGLLEMTVLTGGAIYRTVYDMLGRKVMDISPNQYNKSLDDLAGHKYNGDVGNRYTYYDDGNLKTEKDPLNYTTQYFYDMYGNLVKKIRPNSSILGYQYDNMDRLTREYYKDSESSSEITLKTYSYATLSDKSTQKTVTEYLNDDQTAITVYVYDYAERLIEQQNPDGTKTKTEFYPNGKAKCVIAVNGSITEYKYDGMNRLSEQWVPLEVSNGNTYYMYSKFEYDKADRKTAEVKGRDKVLLWAIPSNLFTTNYTYYNNDLQKTVTDSEGAKTVFQYDAESNVIREDVYTTASEMLTTEYTYNHLNKVVDKKVHVKVADLAGKALDNPYDTISLTKHTYDLNGNVRSVTDPNSNTITNDYDAMDRLIGTSQPGKNEFDNSVDITTSIVYDWDGKVLQSTDALGRDTFNNYNPRGFLTSVRDALNGITSFEYDRAGRKITEVSPKNYESGKSLSQMNRTEYVYDLMDRVKTVNEIYKGAQGTWQNYYSKLYQYDNGGNISKVVDALGYEAGTGLTPDERIISGYGTETIYNYTNQVSQLIDPVSKQRGLAFSQKYEYDGMGRKIAETNANGVITNYDLDGAGNVLSVQVQKSAGSVPQTVKVSTYDLADRMLTQKDGNGNTTYFTYNAFGKIRTAADPGDETIPSYNISNQYDLAGNLKVQQDNTGKVISYNYDRFNRLISQSEMKSDNSQVIAQSYKYDLAGNKRFVTDGRGITTENTYDGLNRLKTTSITSGAITQTTTYDYDANGNQTYITNWLGNITKNIYDPLNRLIEKQDAYDVSIQKLEYNNNNVQVKSYDALNNCTSYEYDRNNRLVTTVDPENHSTSQYYDNVGNIISKTDGRNNTVNYAFDEFNRLTSVTNSRGETTSYSYDLNGNMLSQKDGRGYLTIIEYNVMNKPVKKINDGGRTGSSGHYTYLNEKVESYSYYPDGSMKSKTDRNGKITNYTYDIHGRLLEQAIGSEKITFTYDENGNQRTMTDSTGTTERTYDNLNRVLTKIVPNFGTTRFDYDITSGVPPGYVVEKTTDFKGNVTEKVADKAGRLSTVTAGGKTSTYGYYPDGSRQFVLYPNGSREDYTYNRDKTLWTLTNKNATGTVLDSYTYKYDNAHNQSSKSDSKGITYYSYDSLNRLDSVTEPSLRKTTYMYDKAGNRYSESVTSGSSVTVTTYQYDEQNRLVSSYTQLNGLMQVTSYTYDANGNMMSKTAATVKPAETGDFAGFNVARAGNSANKDATFYEYDSWNQLIKAVDGYNTAAYKYNGEGLRVEKSKTELVTLLSDDFNSGMQMWTSTTNAVVNGGQLTVTNNTNFRSTLPGTDQWKDFVLEADVKINETAAGLVFKSADNNNGYCWQLNAASGKLRTQKIVNGTVTTLKEVTCPITQSVWYHIKIQAIGSTIKTYIDGLLIDTTSDTTFTSGNAGFRQSGTESAAFDNFTLSNAGASSMSTVRYLYSRDKVILETDADGNQTARNIYGTNLLSRVTGIDTLYYMYNGHADVTSLFKEDGTIAASYYYDAFGNILEQTGNVSNSILYAGYQYDTETGLYYLNARYYDSKIARFLSEDTYTGDINDPLSLNLYTYCNNNPIIYDDPDGHFLHILIGALAGGVIGGAIEMGMQLASGTDLDDLDWKKIGGASASGAISGAVGAATGGASLLVTAAASTAAAAAGSVVNQQIVTGRVDLRQTATDAAFGGLTTVGGAVASKVLKPVVAKASNVVRETATKVAGEVKDAVVSTGKLLATSQKGSTNLFTGGLGKSAANEVKKEVKQGALPKGSEAVTRTGPKGIDPAHHNANVMVKDAKGNVVSHERVVSGNMTTQEKSLGFPKNTLASHTEARAVKNTPLKQGDKMTITGQRPPCPSCKGQMNKVAQEIGASIQYQWRWDGKTQKWVAK